MSDIGTMVEIGRAWAEKHREETGHQVWTHFRSIGDFHLERFDCSGRMPGKSRDDGLRGGY